MKKLLFLLPLLCSLSAVSAQRNSYFEAGFLFGLTNYSGDIAESSIEISETQPGYGIYFRYHFSKNVSVKAHVYSGSISGDDANSKNLQMRKLRFSTSIVEFGAVAEWKFFGQERYSSTGIHNFFVTPYAFLGLGLSYTDPKAEYYGDPKESEKYLRTPLPEEGLNKTFLLAPMGIGLRADVLDRLVVGIEGGWRPVFSDDLDGIRVNGNPGKGDWYYFAGLTVSFILSDPKRRQ
ncbi:MAG: outer membrane beta-barrel protein [Lewinellaceae bacterium]|nr:outer membrane beta-barrel protein [Saprospiraceae bacterium]MCB9307453.1 outer membrane beta-barrel protein [Lewinellaceae bacterium]MCB9355296.1 outer membrane beta-barrel protein [Lewinellaceae bacterium]